MNKYYILIALAVFLLLTAGSPIEDVYTPTPEPTLTPTPDFDFSATVMPCEPNCYTAITGPVEFTARSPVVTPMLAGLLILALMSLWICVLFCRRQR